MTEQSIRDQLASIDCEVEKAAFLLYIQLTNKVTLEWVDGTVTAHIDSTDTHLPKFYPESQAHDAIIAVVAQQGNGK